jgi:cytochrome bd-type quinol oxidase subunit 2
MAFDYRKKWRSKTYNRVWDWGMFLGSLIPPFLFGVVLSSALQGVPLFMEKTLVMRAGLGDVVSLFTIWSGLFLVLLCINIGLARVARLVNSGLQVKLQKKQQITSLLLIIAGIIEIVLLAMNTNAFGHKNVGVVIFFTVILVASLLLTAWTLRTTGEQNLRKNFWLSVISMGSFSLVLFASFYNALIVGTKGYTLTLELASSGHESQMWVAWATGVMLPLMVIGQTIAYYLTHRVYTMPDNEMNY